MRNTAKTRNIIITAICLTLVMATGISLAALRKTFYDKSDEKKMNILGKAEEFRLINQDNQEISSLDFPGKIKVMGMVYTRCGMPEMCPLTTKNFASIQKLLPAEYKDKTVILLLSFDPEYDTPDIMKKYGKLYTDDFSNWHFLTGKRETIDKVLENYNFIAEFNNDDKTYRHETTAFLIDGNENVRKIYFLNMWKPEEVVRDIETLLDE